MKRFSDSVFINCPFDKRYQTIFDAKVFAIFDCGFLPRTAKEENDSGAVRIEKISKIIRECKYGIHDLSRTELGRNNSLPRFNMPLELGLFLGAKKYGSGVQKRKNTLIIDTKPHRYQEYISDIAGQDIGMYKANELVTIISTVRDWLNASQTETIPGGILITNRFERFKKELPMICKAAGLTKKELTYNDYATFVSNWCQMNPLN